MYYRVMKTYKFKLYQHKRNRFLHNSINAAGNIYNYCIALYKRFFRIFGQHLNSYKLMKHIAKLRKKNTYWQLVGSQAVQEIIQRIEKAYQLFFQCHQRGVRPPSFKKRRRYKSFTLKQAGYKLLEGNKIRIGKKTYRFWKSQEIQGQIKTVTIKRNPLGELFVIIVTDYVAVKKQLMTGKIAGFDFGLKTFLTVCDGSEIASPLFLKKSLKELRRASRNYSRKQKGSAHRERARKHLVRVHERVVNQRQDWFWKLAHQLTGKYDYLFFETLNLKGMQRLWGRKINDLALANFLEILQYVAACKGKTVDFIDRWYPSSKTCSHCDYKLAQLPLELRRWRCPQCGAQNDRDLNAAVNIRRVGASTHELGDVRQSLIAIAV